MRDRRRREQDWAERDPDHTAHLEKPHPSKPGALEQHARETSPALGRDGPPPESLWSTVNGWGLPGKRVASAQLSSAAERDPEDGNHWRLSHSAPLAGKSKVSPAGKWSSPSGLSQTHVHNPQRNRGVHLCHGDPGQNSKWDSEPAHVFRKRAEESKINHIFTLG